MSEPDWSFQGAAVARVQAALAAGQGPVLLVSPTGSGKTTMFTMVIVDAVAEGKRVVVLVPRIELLDQVVERLYKAGVSAGVVRPDVPYQPTMQVQVCMIPTLHRRAIAGTRMGLPAADLVVIDEAHHAPAASIQAIVAGYQGAEILGVTATPARGDGRGLGAMFKTMIEAETISGLVRLGVICPPARVYGPVDETVTAGVKTTAGDFNRGQLGKVMNQPKLVGDVTRDWLLHGQRRLTIVFAVDRAHAVDLCNSFCQAGVMAAYVDGATPADERQRILADLRAGRIEVVVNCMVLTEGFDCPPVSCIVLARPTKSFPLYLQMLGRGMRACPGKSNWILIDHSGSIYRHGFPDEPIQWTLQPDKKAARPLQAARERGAAKGLVACPECGAVRQQGEACPACGWRPKQRAEGVETLDGELGLVTRKRQSVGVSIDQRMQFYRELLGYAREIRLDTKEPRHKDGWAAHSYKEKFGEWPSWDWQRMPTVVPSDATRSWVRSRYIARAKGRARPGRAA